MRHTTRTVVLAAVFLVQIAGIVHARFVRTRYLCWAPYDQISFFRIEADRGGQALSPTAIAERYRMPAAGRENRAIDNVLQTIAQFEATRGRLDPLNVRVIYHVNGGPEQTWHAPR